MSTKAWYHPWDTEVDLARLPIRLYEEIASLHGQITRDGPLVLTCLGNGAPMYVYRHQNGRYFARHYPGENIDGHRHRIASSMSDEHRRQAEYVERAASDHGLDATLELSTGNGTRLDVGVRGAANTGFEVQRSALSRKAAQTRTTKSFAAGWTSAWVSDRPVAPDWSGYVPTARLAVRGWDEGMPPRNSAHAIIQRFFRVRVGLNSWTYDSEPQRVTLDELAYRMPAGDVVPVRVGTQGRVSLAHREAVDVIDSVTYPGASRWIPGTDLSRHKEAVQRYTTECHHGGARTYPSCRFCGHPLWAPQSQRRGFCESCALGERR